MKIIATKHNAEYGYTIDVFEDRSVRLTNRNGESATFPTVNDALASVRETIAAVAR